MGRTCNNFQYKLITKGKYDGNINNGKSHIKLPEQVKYEKRTKTDSLANLLHLATFLR